MGALDGLRVIDFGHYIAGPLAAVMLADQGADVIHVDPPADRPGPARWRPDTDAFLQRGKRRLSLDLKNATERETAQRLIGSADVVIENFRPGVADRLGIGAAASTERNPRLIYCSIPGFAPDDPRADMQAWEGILYAATDNCIPRAGEEPPEWDWSRPFYSAVTLPSNFGAFLGATGIVMALIARERTGLGQRVEVPLFDAMFTLIGHSGAYANARGLHSSRGIHGRGAGAFRCKDDKYVQFDTSSARHLVWFAQQAGITDWGPDLLDILRLRDESLNQKLHSRLRELFLTRTALEWEELGLRAGAALAWARTTSEWLNTEHARQLGAVTHLNDPELGPTWMAGLPVHLTKTPGAPQGPRHLPDADHAEVLHELEVLSSPVMNTPPDASVPHPLSGMKVLDLCVALAGPTCGRLLLEFGADVVKINAPKAGVSGYLNRGKRSLLLDLESFESQQVFWQLLESADVLVENFSPGTADRLGIGYREVKARKPDVVYCSISSYGQFGPWQHGRGWERQGQAVAGIMERQEPPAILGPYNLIDIGTGTLGTFATALGLYHRLRSGEGQHVQASLCQTATYQQTPYMLDYAGHVSSEPRGYLALGTGPLNRFYKASDRWFFLALPDENAGLLQNVDGVSSTAEADLEEAFGTATADEWVRRLRKHGIPAQVRVPVAELMTDPDVKRRGLSVCQNVEGVGETTAPGLPVRLSRTPMQLGDPPRRPGSDAAAILEEIGMSAELPNLEKAWLLQVNDLPPAW